MADWQWVGRSSVRTVENPVLKVMNKLGLDNSAEVAAWYARTRSRDPRPQIDRRRQALLGFCRVVRVRLDASGPQRRS